MLSVRHGPLPWTRQLEIAIPEIVQIYVSRRTRIYREHAWDDTSWGGEVRQLCTYDLFAIDGTARQRGLVRGLDNSDDAQFLEAALRTRLALPDRPRVGQL